MADTQSTHTPTRRSQTCIAAEHSRSERQAVGAASGTNESGASKASGLSKASIGSAASSEVAASGGTGAGPQADVPRTDSARRAWKR
jgi:hypothetical protein